MNTYTLREAADLLGGQISYEALRKRVQKPDTPTGIRSVIGKDGKRRIPRSELEHHFRVSGSQDVAAVIRELSETIASKEAELITLRALPERLAAEREALAERGQSAERRAQDAENRATELETRLSDLRAASWLKRRKLLQIK
jgi:chromosome segregation ATPase